MTTPDPIAARADTMLDELPIRYHGQVRQLLRDAFEKHLREAIAEQLRAMKPDMWWRAVDPEYSIEDPEQVIDEDFYPVGTVIQFQAARRLPDRFMTVHGDEESSQSLRPSTRAEIEAHIASITIAREKRIAERAFEKWSEPS